MLTAKFPECLLQVGTIPGPSKVLTFTTSTTHWPRDYYYPPIYSLIRLGYREDKQVPSLPTSHGWQHQDLNHVVWLQSLYKGLTWASPPKRGRTQEGTKLEELLPSIFHLQLLYLLLRFHALECWAWIIHWTRFSINHYVWFLSFFPFLRFYYLNLPKWLV